MVWGRIGRAQRVSEGAAPRTVQVRPHPWQCVPHRHPGALKHGWVPDARPLEKGGRTDAPGGEDDLTPRPKLQPVRVAAPAGGLDRHPRGAAALDRHAPTQATGVHAQVLAVAHRVQEGAVR